MEENKNITVNGVEFTPEMLEQLKEWNLNDEKESVVLRLMASLVSLQDYFCKRIWDLGYVNVEEEAKCISKIMDLKSQLNPFLRKKLD